MKSKTLISGIIVITIIIGLVMMFTSDPNNKDAPQVVSAADDKNLATVTETSKVIKKNKAINKSRVSKETQGKNTNKVGFKKSTKTVDVDKSKNDFGHRVTRVRRPGHKFRMVRVDTTSIPPKSELRKWSRNQWVAKVSSLQKAGENSLAQEYITAYNAQYPHKDLNNYLK